ncbi:MAG: DUF2459 domain-containing protein [Alphaproteobacteria bacterium]|jgi:uncharacterized protein (TIGR02117 family)|nr:DUF2459 domain-containing protein [Alphaproteobacteria bacterium]MDP6815769.1 DUF2459 domain-containing protein [Alphaproteobacteria bacterium]
MIWRAIFLTVVLLCADLRSAQAQDEGAHRLIHVANYGWHTGLIVDAAEPALAALPEAAVFPDARYLEFGWGDAEFYRAPEITVAMAMRAALTPTKTVMHLNAMPRPPRQYYLEAEIVTLRVAAAKLPAMIAFIRDSFARDDAGAARPAGAGRYPGSRFYEGAGEYHLLNTCNTWTARALRQAGLAVDPGNAVTADDLMAQLRPLAVAPENR